MAIRFYHLALELDMLSGNLLRDLSERGLEFPSVMTLLDDKQVETARRVAAGEVRFDVKPGPGEATEIKLPPPVVPAPARPIRPAQPVARAVKRRTPDQRGPRSAHGAVGKWR